jgi:hypothetical protein
LCEKEIYFYTSLFLEKNIRKVNSRNKKQGRRQLFHLLKIP